MNKKEILEKFATINFFWDPDIVISSKGKPSANQKPQEEMKVGDSIAKIIF
jgi:hypothetical protein